MLLNKLQQLVSKTDLKLTELQLNALVNYVQLLDKWNKAYNLTSVRDPQEMLVKHIMDSLMVGQYLQGEHFIDVGTGPGLPGIPLAILLPKKQFTLLDSLGKRVRFLKQVVFELKLTNVTPVQARVEQFEPEQPLDGVLSRAFASLEDMLHWCHHLVDETGYFYALKGQYPEQELANLPENIACEHSYQVQVPELIGDRHLILLKKINRL